MAKRKLSVEEVRDAILSEGLGYAVQHAISSREIANSDLSDLWSRAAELLEEIQEFIDDEADESDLSYDDDEEDLDDDDEGLFD